MQFNSYIFILLFLPCFVCCYFLLGKLHGQAGKILIILSGIIFYIYGGPETAAVLGISIVLNYVFCLILNAGKRPKILPAFFIICNISLLFYYKYYNFSITAINSAFHTAFSLKQTVLPLGISFFTFQQIMFLVSVFRGEIVKPGLTDYLAYILYFPKIIMGPLADPVDILSQLNDPELRKFNMDNLASGLKLFSLGLFKKMVLADTFTRGVSWGFSNPDIATAGDLFLVMLFYTFEIYFDFSGYSDMAVGISKMINITLPINFDSPYKAYSVRNFWKRWHMSLTGFLTKYVYYPLGGSRKGKLRTAINIMIVFLVSGIWHGANWTFILWGCIYGLLQNLERFFSKQYSRLHSAVKWFYTFFTVNVLWLLFRSDSIVQWLEMLRKMFSFQNMSISEGLIRSFLLPEIPMLFDLSGLTGLSEAVRGLPMLGFTIASFAICLIPENNYRNSGKINVINMVLCAAAFVWAFLCLSSESIFIYSNF